MKKITNVKMKGSVNKKFIPYILSKSSVNILNSSQSLYNWARGSSCNKLFEYMASGKPVISTIKTGYSTIEKYNCGVELNACTPEELAKEILRI
jgi:glycosyltransferase involved in cell wall biosynthesis